MRTTDQADTQAQAWGRRRRSEARVAGRIPQILEALAALGRARVVNGLWTLG